MSRTVILIAAAVLMIFSNGFVKKTDGSISQGLGLYAFPTQDQDAETQEMDEYKCFKWAKEQTGYDPLNPPDIKPQQAQTGPSGVAVKSTGGGAAAGAAVGAIAGDAGKGAAIGATLGAFRGLAAKGKEVDAKEAAAKQSVEQQQAAMLNDFRKAYSVCLEAKGYAVK